MKLDDFLKCKKVRCVNVGGHVYIAAGKEYDVINLDEDSVYIVNDNHEECDYLYKYFEPVLESEKNPLQGVELTPESETESSEPKFKVGDKVYLFGTNYIEEITKIIGANVYLAGADFDASVSVKEICHANPENYERLQATFPDIEFEQPPKPDAVERSLTLVERIQPILDDLMMECFKHGFHQSEMTEAEFIDYSRKNCVPPKREIIGILEQHQSWRKMPSE